MLSPAPAEKKISSWVRPGVCEVRASALRPVSALIRLDLPTLERPAKAISLPAAGGSVSIELADQTNCQSPANSLRPASISAGVKPAASVIGLAAAAEHEHRALDARADHPRELVEALDRAEVNVRRVVPGLRQ